MKYLTLFLILIIIAEFGFTAAWCIAKPIKKKKCKSRPINELQDLHCFECEIEMPVKEKNGCLYCSNCGLKH